MAGQAQMIAAAHPLAGVLKEIEAAVLDTRRAGSPMDDIKDIRWHFDQTSAKMNQAIYNGQQDLIHDSTLKTVVLLIEILSRS